MINNRIKKISDYVFGEIENFSLEHRIFLSALFVGITITILGGLVNFILAPSPIAVLIPFLLSVIQLITYYYVRFKKLFAPFATPVIIIAIFGISAIWVFNGGINGSNIMPAFIILILGILVVPNQIKKYIIILFISVNILILLIQLYRPDLIVNFPTEKARWIDNLITLIYSSYFIYIIIRFVHKNYTIERLRAEKSEKRLHQLNVDKDRFISILGHDLKNPFNNILGLSEILTDEIDNLTKDEIKEIAGNINNSVKNTSKLLEDILIWARTQQGIIPFKPQRLSLSATCNNIIDVLKPGADAKQIAIKHTLPDGLFVFADEYMVNAVLRNLVSNAIKFTNKGGTIHISAEQTDTNITISVSDNGIGISHDNYENLFNISQIISTKGTAGEKGTGLGLLLCKEFVEKNGGRIWVDTEIGKGSDFKFTLPSN